FGLPIWSATNERGNVLFNVLFNECPSFLCAQRRPNNFIHLPLPSSMARCRFVPQAQRIILAELPLRLRMNPLHLDVEIDCLLQLNGPFLFRVPPATHLSQRALVVLRRRQQLPLFLCDQLLGSFPFPLPLRLKRKLRRACHDQLWLGL